MQLAEKVQRIPASIVEPGDSVKLGPCLPLEHVSTDGPALHERAAAAPGVVTELRRIKR